MYEAQIHMDHKFASINNCVYIIVYENMGRF